MSLRDDIKSIFVESYWRLKDAARKIVGDADAEDVVQDAFVKISESKSDFRGDADVQTYLYKVVQNQARRMIRKRSTGIDGKTLRPTVFYDRNEDEKIPMSDSCRSVHDVACKVAAEKAEDANMLPQYTEPLSVADKDLMELRKLGKKWYLKAPEILGISPGSARVRLTRLTDKIRKDIEMAQKEAI